MLCSGAAHSRFYCLSRAVCGSDVLQGGLNIGLGLGRGSGIGSGVASILIRQLLGGNDLVCGVLSLVQRRLGLIGNRLGVGLHGLQVLVVGIVLLPLALYIDQPGRASHLRHIAAVVKKGVGDRIPYLRTLSSGEGVGSRQGVCSLAAVTWHARRNGLGVPSFSWSHKGVHPIYKFLQLAHIV